MHTATFRDWLEIIGIFGVIASLVFVGLEMRQSQRIALSAAYQARADSSMTLRLSALEPETLQSARAKEIQGMGPDQLTPQEAVVLRSRWNSQLVYLDNMHYQYVNGFIAEEQWQANRASLASILSRNAEWSSPLVENCVVFREAFCAEIKAAAGRIKPSE